MLSARRTTARAVAVRWRRAAAAAVVAAALAGCSSAATHASGGTPSPGLAATGTAAPAGTGPTTSPSPGGTGGPGTPTGGLQPVSPSPQDTRPAVPAGSPAPFGNGVTGRLTGSQAVTTQGAGLGQLVGAPAVAVTLQLTNGTSAALSLRYVNVTAAYGPAGTPGVTQGGPPGRPFSGTLAPGASVSGTYVFGVPLDARQQVTITLNYDPAQPTVVFTGPVG